jgi:hypothetical protein
MVERRGRPSRESLEIVPLIPGDAKPAAPADMSEREADIWRSIVDAMPLRHFGRETWPVMRGLVHHMVAAETAWLRYNKALNSDGKRAAQQVDRWGEIHNRESRAVRQHSADLRLTKIARISRQEQVDRSVRNQVIRKPWDD